MSIKYPEYEHSVVKGNSEALLTFDLEIDFKKIAELGVVGTGVNTQVDFAKAFPLRVKQVQYYKKSGTGNANFKGRLMIGETVIVEDAFDNTDKSYIGKVEGTGDFSFFFEDQQSDIDVVVVFRIFYEVA